MTKKGVRLSKAVAAVAVVVMLIIGLSPAWAQQQIVGWVQKVRVFPGDLLLRAKMDSGAKTSSINVQKIQRFERDGRRWVRFSVTDAQGKTATFERPEVGQTRIKRRGGGFQTRPVITLRLCLGSIAKFTPVNLADRAGFNYQLLVGRRFLKGDFLIDPSATFVAAPDCAAAR